MASLSTRNSGPSKQLFPKRLVDVPAAQTELTDRNGQIFQIHIANKSANPVTVNVEDGTGFSIIPTVSVAANQAYIGAWPEGQDFEEGLYVTAGAAASIDLGFFVTVEGL